MIGSIVFKSVFATTVKFQSCKLFKKLYYSKSFDTHGHRLEPVTTLISLRPYSPIIVHTHTAQSPKNS